jgi:hypothetical protein
VEELLDQVVAMALDQADEIEMLDAARAEAWASDLVALARESLGPDGPTRVAQRLVAKGGKRAVTALVALDAITDLVSDIDLATLGEPPRWADAAGTSTCREALEVRNRRGLSLAFRFADIEGSEHLLVVDLVPGPPEQLGEVNVAGGDVFDAAAEEDADLEIVDVPVGSAAARVASALAATRRPRPSAAVNGQLLTARLGPLTDVPIEPPAFQKPDVPPAPELEPEDSRYALSLLDRGLAGSTAATSELDPSALAAAAEQLRDAARADEPLAVWLAASFGPVDLDEDDRTVVVAALAATICPRTLGPLDEDQREATLVLEWVDWLGAVLELCRAGVGASALPSDLVDRINRCPEVSTSVAARDRPRIEWAFAVMTEPWSALSVVDTGGLSGLGLALLPDALRMAWAAPRP